MKIYTKKGDDGTTGLQGNKRVSKSNSRISAYGTVDEINSILGIVLSNKLDDDISKLLTKVQNDLFSIGADLSNPDMSTPQRVNEEMVSMLENQIDKMEKELAPITKFILPGGDKIASFIHNTRSVTRRAETMVVSLSKNEPINQICIKYLNRLSDLLFVVARVINKRKGINDVFWEP